MQADVQDFAQFSLQALSIPAKCQIAKDFFCNKIKSSFLKINLMEFNHWFWNCGGTIYFQAAKAQYVLVWCWAAALGAGLLKSDDLLMGASRLRVSYDIQYEIENLELLMDEAAKASVVPVICICTL